MTLTVRATGIRAGTLFPLFYGVAAAVVIGYPWEMPGPAVAGQLAQVLSHAGG